MKYVGLNFEENDEVLLKFLLDRISSMIRASMFLVLSYRVNSNH